MLGAGIVGTSIALHLVKRGLAVTLIDRGEPGEGTSYGNAGIIEGNTVFPAAFPASFTELARIALKRSTLANYHLGFLPKVAPWLLAFRAASQPARLIETAQIMRPFLARAVPEHDALAAESGAERHFSRRGWLKLYRTRKLFEAQKVELDLAARFGIANVPLDRDGALALEPALNGVFRHAVHWTGAVSVNSPLAVTRAYAARLQCARRFDADRGRALAASFRPLLAGGDRTRARSMPAMWWSRSGRGASMCWRRSASRCRLRSSAAITAITAAQGNAALSRPVLDAQYGYVLAPMEQGIRLTTGVEFAPRDAPATPAQFARLMPAAKALFPLGEPVEPQPWLGARPCFADSRPVIGRSPGQRGLWLAFGHGHWGLTLGPATGRLMAEMMTGATPFCDPKPFSAERFGK